MLAPTGEFSVATAYPFDRSGPRRWILSHLLRYKRFAATFLLGSTLANVLLALLPTLTGAAFTAVLQPGPARTRLAHLALILLAVVLVKGALDVVSSFSDEILGKRLERDSREELYVSLLGKSQTFHNRQRVGDIMARAANDVGQINLMITPGLYLIVESLVGLTIPLVFIGFIQPQLLLSPLVFTAVFLVVLRRYIGALQPVAGAMRAQFGVMNAGLAESVTGIDVVKSTARESFEVAKFEANARRYRDLFVKNGQIQARYLPPLLLAVAFAGAFLHGLLLVSQHRLSIGGLVTYMGLMGLLRFPTFISIFTFSLMSFGIAAAERIIGLLREEAELDENVRGHDGEMKGGVVFEHVTFSYGGRPVLRDVSFHAEAGQTVAIVGQTGSGKSTLTKLVNRIYDAGSGRVLVDGLDVREWSLDGLRSQISTIEQDIVLFSRSIAENIAFSRGQQADQVAVEKAARDAQAHDFIVTFKEGYETVVGERGVTLSGGQRQRIAIARALLTDPRILVLDDSTSAIDSATEDEIQRALQRLMRGRTTLLITHRLSQIRWADKILVLDKGELIDQGTHEELLARCAMYRRIFAPYDMSQDATRLSESGARRAGEPEAV